MEDANRRRCELCIRLDIRGSMHRSREHQHVHDVVVNVRRHELRPPRGSHEFGQKRLEQLGRCPCAHQERDIERIHQNLGYPSAQQMEQLFRVSDEATESLKHLSCDACSRLKQPPAPRQVAIAHAEMLSDVASVDVNFWKLQKCNSREENTKTVLGIVDAASGMHIATTVPIQTVHTVGDFRARMASLG